MDRLLLSPPLVNDDDLGAVTRAMKSGWIAPLGPEVDALENDLASVSGREHAIVLASGTAALHLGLLALGVGLGDEVVVPTMTFGATAFAVTYTGASPVFLDVEEKAWTLDPEVLITFLEGRQAAGQLPAAVVPVDVFGRTCDYQAILPICEKYEVPILADSAEALGATCGSTPAGSFGAGAIFSFNGNKIITTSGGGALVTDDAEIARKVRYWATQAREPFPWYEHEDIGFNYRMSNVLAALGRAQLSRLDAIVSRRREIWARYSDALADARGLTVMADPPWGSWNGWITTIRFDLSAHPNAPTRVREALERHDIESRPVWKPMHQQPVFLNAERFLTGVADRIFCEGLCLPSGTAMTDDDVDRVTDVILRELL